MNQGAHAAVENTGKLFGNTDGGSVLALTAMDQSMEKLKDKRLKPHPIQHLPVTAGLRLRKNEMNFDDFDKVYKHVIKNEVWGANLSHWSAGGEFYILWMYRPPKEYEDIRSAREDFALAEKDLFPDMIPEGLRILHKEIYLPYISITLTAQEEDKELVA